MYRSPDGKQFFSKTRAVEHGKSIGHPFPENLAEKGGSASKEAAAKSEETDLSMVTCQPFELNQAHG